MGAKYSIELLPVHINTLHYHLEHGFNDIENDLHAIRIIFGLFVSFKDFYGISMTNLIESVTSNIEQIMLTIRTREMFL